MPEASLSDQADTMMKPTDETQIQPESTPNSANRSALASPGRRALALNSLKVAPAVIVTLSARSALAAECWSGKMSGNLSHPNNGCVLGLSPGYYKNKVRAVGSDPGWPPGFLSGCRDIDANGTISQACKDTFNDPALIGSSSVKGTRFGKVFTPTPYSPDLTLMQVLWQKEGSFAFHAIAAYFNALNFSSYVMKPDIVLFMVNSILATGQYNDGHGTIWNETTMKAYLNSTWT